MQPARDGAGVETDAAGLGGERERAPRSEDVDTLVGALTPRRPEVVRRTDGAEHREDDLLPRRRLGLRLRAEEEAAAPEGDRGSRPCGEAEKG